MSDAAIQKALLENIARTIAQRELLARALAHIAMLEDDPERFFQKLSAAGDKRVNQTQEDNSLLGIAEFVRSEIDWILVEARDILKSDLR
jgi:hypothetical protein